MNRRHFLHLGSLAAAGLIFDPELNLWRPPKVMITVPGLTRRHVSIADLMAVTFDAVIKDYDARGRVWSDRAIIREIAKDAHDALARRQ